MTKTQTYTAYMPVEGIDNDDTVIARGLSSIEAMKIAFGYGDRLTTHLSEEDYETFALYTWRAYSRSEKTGYAPREPLQATVVRSGQPELEKNSALTMIAAQFVRRQRPYWDGQIVPDEEFDKRVKRVAKIREVRRIDREISAKLVDAFIAGGYTITCDLNDFDPEFKRSTDRDGILAYMWYVEIVELHVHKGKTRGWLRLIFDENGWDLVQDYTVDLEHIIEPICEPYLPPGLRNIGSPESSVCVLTLDSPDDVLEIEGMLK